MLTSRLLVAACAIAFLSLPAASQQRGAAPEKVLLWPGGAPGALGAGEEDQPTLTLYPAPEARSTGAAVVVCPGGGYRSLAMDHEGVQIARWLNSIGVSAFVLRYRLGPKYNHPTQKNDVLRALRWVRSRAADFDLESDRVGVWGFSAGGHLASTAATHFDAGDASADDPVERVSSRPDFAILSYPVVTFTDEEYVHKGSRRNLLGDDPNPELVELLSNEKRVTAQTPPTFLFHTNEDTGVPPENSVLFYLALRRAGVPAELHIYEQGRHGVGLASTDRALSSWSGRLADWLYGRGLLMR